MAILSLISARESQDDEDVNPISAGSRRFPSEIFDSLRCCSAPPAAIRCDTFSESNTSHLVDQIATSRLPQESPFSFALHVSALPSGLFEDPVAAVPTTEEHDAFVGIGDSFLNALSDWAPAVASSQSPLQAHKSRRIQPQDLSEMLGNLASYASDQHGSRFIQQRLDCATPLERRALFTELLPIAGDLITDVFGNYVVQKFLEIGTPQQRSQLCDRLAGRVAALSLQLYGCRVVQRALEVASPEQQSALVRELDGCVLRCIRDQNGNHVIQKCIECVPLSACHFILDALAGRVSELAQHPYGCRVLQRIFEFVPVVTSRPLLDELLPLGKNFASVTQSLICDQYGNYVMQHVLEHGPREYRDVIVSRVKGSLLVLSKHKFASNVVEKCVAFASHTDRRFLIEEGLDGEGVLLQMMKDQFANYVVQKMLDVADSEQRQRLLGLIKPHFGMLRKFPYGKHIISKVERQLGVDG